MAEANCAVCGKTVKDTDQDEHLRSQHLGPHYFWFNAVKHRTENPSMRGGEIIRLCNGNTRGHITEDRDGEWIHYSHDSSIDLTRGPHLFILLPASSFAPDFR